MSDFHIGDRVKVTVDLTGIDAFIGRTGTITREGSRYDDTLASTPTVRLDGYPEILRSLHFAPQELELIEPDGDADQADAARDMDLAERLIGGAQ